MPLYNKEPSQTYYVVFQKSESNRFWNYFLWNHYDHVFLLQPHLEGTLKLNPLANNIIIDYIPHPTHEVADSYRTHEQVIDIVIINLPLVLQSGYTARGIITCVTIVKATLGIGKWFILTPQQLRRHLLRIGGRSIKYGRSHRPSLQTGCCKTATPLTKRNNGTNQSGSNHRSRRETSEE